MLLLLACAAQNPAVEVAQSPLQSCDLPEERAKAAAQVEAIELPTCLHVVFPDEAQAEAFRGEARQELKALQINQVNRQLRGAPEADYQERRLNTGIQLSLEALELHVDERWSRLGEASAEEREQGLYAMARSWGQAGCVDVFVLMDEDASWEGAWASYPDSEQPGALAAVNHPDPRKLAHEWGHVLGLRHTHEQIWGAEWESPQDCDVNGDLLCDTPPDPGPDICKQIDERGDTNAQSRSRVRCPEAYRDLEDAIPLDNLMSYWDPPWQSQGFSEEQAERMACTWTQAQGELLGI